MNLSGYLTGTIKALGVQSDWAKNFNLSKMGLKESFIAVGLTLVFYYICALAVQTQRAIMIGAEAPMAIPLSAFWLILLLYALSFVGCVYLFTQVFDKQDRFRAWVIVRHWTVFFMSFLAALSLGLFVLGFLPFSWAITGVFALYLATLIVDIRLAQKIGGFDWGAAILVGCVIHAIGLAFILTGVMQVSA